MAELQGDQRAQRGLDTVALSLEEGLQRAAVEAVVGEVEALQRWPVVAEQGEHCGRAEAVAGEAEVA